MSYIYNTTESGTQQFYKKLPTMCITAETQEVQC